VLLAFAAIRRIIGWAQFPNNMIEDHPKAHQQQFANGNRCFR
jgi:hypothetical protein